MLELSSCNQVKIIACGESHAMALTDGNELFSWGNNSYGQLGHGTRDNENLPKRIDFLLDQQIKTIGCGANHSMVVTMEGTLIVWGNGANGRLGLNSVDIQLQPVVCGAMSNALRETGTVGPQMLSDLQGTNIPLEKMTEYLARGKAISQRVQEKLDANIPVDMQQELEGMDLGADPNVRENMILVRAAAISSGTEPATLINLQQLVKSDSKDARLELEEEQKRIEVRNHYCMGLSVYFIILSFVFQSLRFELDKVVRKNDNLEMMTIQSYFKIGNVIKNQVQLQTKLSERFA
jgi:hypothetical protein